MHTIDLGCCLIACDFQNRVWQNLQHGCHCAMWTEFNVVMSLSFVTVWASVQVFLSQPYNSLSVANEALFFHSMIRFRAHREHWTVKRIMAERETSIFSPFGHVYNYTNSGIIQCPNA